MTAFYPRFTEEIVNQFLNGASKVFNWADIPPTILGDLKNELNEIKSLKVEKSNNQKLTE